MSESITQSEEEQDESSQNVGGAFVLAGALKTSVKHKGRPVLIENSACLTQTQMNQMLSSIVHLCFCVSSLLEPRGQMELLSMSSVFIRDDWTHRKCWVLYLRTVVLISLVIVDAFILTVSRGWWHSLGLMTVSSALSNKLKSTRTKLWRYSLHFHFRNPQEPFICRIFEL